MALGPSQPSKTTMVRRRCLLLAVLAAMTLAVAAPEAAEARPKRRATATKKARPAKRARAPRRVRRARRARVPRGPAPCRNYRLGGPVRPLCANGGRGHILVTNVAGTNITVNVAFVNQATAFVNAGRHAGFNLHAWDEVGPGYGSFRTRAMQAHLRRLGYPANRPGRSMHEWGLAIDFGCNGKRFIDDPSNHWCRAWVFGNAGNYGIYFHPNEPWHGSTNGR